ncbi:hypothetical protein G5T42_10110 [Microbacterium sp. 4R-513]|uniref:hypothetical protein n=1 Tax=Microbacterium sp. 4R-513 TaxID=2567934 RepID=UPI0013E1EC5B|nr:hypothetical protein [Microbacterium sp. 4R-513]QIG39793.1 hypothetical protein G5T42_10110 [Microbacterium sp. 4R-513]
MSSPAEQLRRGSDTATRWRVRARAVAGELLGPRQGTTPLEPGWAAPVVLVWALGRLVNLALLLTAYAVSQIGHWPFGPDGETAPSFLRFLSGWDADRYGEIASVGYPVMLPVDAAGAVQMNNWAFLPLLPILERVLASATGMPWQLAGVVISLVASGAACVVLYALLRHVTSARASWWAVVLFSLGPLSFVFVLGYAESLFLLLIFSALLLAVRRRYLLIAPLGVAAAFTRPGALALALALGILLIGRWMLRTEDPLPRSEVVGLVVSGLATATAGLMWPVVADLVTGEPGAYVQTEMAWWVPFLGGGELVPLAPGLVMGWTWLGPLGVLIILGAVAAAFRWIASGPVRALGLEVVGFALSYTLYLFAVFLPTQSLPRLVLPLAPLLADDRLSRTRRRRAWSLAISIALQVVAVFLLWTLANP